MFASSFLLFIGRVGEITMSPVQITEKKNSLNTVDAPLLIKPFKNFCLDPFESGSYG